MNIDWKTNDTQNKSKHLNIKYLTDDGIQELNQKVTSYADENLKENNKLTNDKPYKKCGSTAKDSDAFYDKYSF